jgi:hypothetical protein
MIRQRHAAVGALVALLAACATTSPPAANQPGAPAPAAAPATAAPAAGTAAATPAARTPGAPAAAPAAAGTPKPFAEVIKDAKQADGLFPLWTKDDKTWIEIPANMIDQPFFLSVGLTRGIGENRLIGGLMGLGGYGIGGEYVGEFRRAGANVQLVARNMRFIAQPGSPEERAVKSGFSDSLLASAPVVSQPHPERKSVLIEATALLLADIPRGSHIIERGYRNSFTFDARNSHIKYAKTNAERTVFDVNAHYSQPRIPIPAPPSPVPGATPPPFYPAPDVLEDPRSLFLGYLYTFSRLPEAPMKPRLADSRIGHFAASKVNFSVDHKHSPVQHYVTRWRLEKKDPKAAVSDPVKPITYWLSNEIPEKYRAPIRDGILEWNKAFEKAGFSNAIVVKQQPDDSDVDLLETAYSSVRWQTTARASYGAIGPSQIDPRTGEILDADVGWDANFVRNARSQRTEEVAYTGMYDEATGEIRVGPMELGRLGAAACSFRELAAREMGFALALLEARGEIDPDSQEADAFVNDLLKYVTMHEVGHTLGLAHNFRASTVNTLQQLADPSHTARVGVVGSVMEYTPANIALKSEKQGQYYTAALGAYDYWAIEYAYKPIEGDERAELARIASRANEPQLAFATDEDAFIGIDPFVNIWDLGSEPLAFFRKRVQLTRELWQRLETRTLKPGESYSVLRRRFLSGLNQASLAMVQAAKYVGGSELQNDHAGSPRLPITPITPKQQREALAIITASLLKTDSFRLEPQFARKLAMDRLERYELPEQAFPAAFELGLPDRLLAVQRDVLNRLMGPVVAKRVLVNAELAGAKGDALTLAELYGSIQRAIWDEARRGVDADTMRRNLQREHLRRMTAALLGSSAAYPADARALMRQDARQLREWLVAAAGKPGLSAETRAHYTEAAETLTEALKAPMVRTGV